jgi:hypothetical protein
LFSTSQQIKRIKRIKQENSMTLCIKMGAILNETISGQSDCPKINCEKQPKGRNISSLSPSLHSYPIHYTRPDDFRTKAQKICKSRGLQSLPAAKGVECATLAGI